MNKITKKLSFTDKEIRINKFNIFVFLYQSNRLGIYRWKVEKNEFKYQPGVDHTFVEVENLYCVTII